MNCLRAVLLLALIFAFTNYPAEGEEDEMIIQKGSQVTLDYTLTVDGEVIESSEGKAPFQYTHGDGAIISGLSRQLEGLHEGDEKEIKVAPEEAYGRVNPDAFQEIPKSQLPPDLEPQVGMTLQLSNSAGLTMPVKVAEVKEDAVVLDMNHPLAGKTLNFQVRIVSVQ